MSLKAISLAVFERLDSVEGLPPLFPHDSPSNPQGKSYILIHIIPAETFSVGLNSIDWMKGIIQLNPYMKDNTGVLSLYDLADTLVDVFPRNLKLKKSGITVRFTHAGWVGPLQPEPGWVTVPVSIPYSVIV